MEGSGGKEANQQVNSRWNPTKEQISMLENMYKQGIRTPTAEQIQQMTTRLKAYGHIEGKNVFYWFQNHKARQRQKQKQENIAYINRILHAKGHLHYHHHPPCSNVVCSSYYLPHGELGFYPQYPVPLPSSFKKRLRTIKINEKRTINYPIPREDDNIMIGINRDGKSYTSNVETLPLFPLRPTGILQGKEAISNAVNSLGSTSDFAEDFINATTITSPPSSCSSDETATGVEACFKDKPFFDFFSGQGDDQRGSFVE